MDERDEKVMLVIRLSVIMSVVALAAYALLQ